MIDQTLAIQEACENLYDALAPQVDELVVQDIERILYESNPHLETILGSYTGLRLNVVDIYPDWYQETFTDMMREAVLDAIALHM